MEDFLLQSIVGAGWWSYCFIINFATWRNCPYLVIDYKYNIYIDFYLQSLVTKDYKPTMYHS